MLSRLNALFLRYAAHHAGRLGGFALPRRGWRRPGRIAEVRRADGVTRVAGWAEATRLRLDWPGGSVEAVPGGTPDAAAGQGAGFALEAPGDHRPLRLTLTLPDGATMSLPVPHPADPPGPAARRRLWRAFLADGLRAVPAALRWALTRDPAARRRVKHALGLEAVPDGVPLDAAYLADLMPDQPPRALTVILPVQDDPGGCLPETLRRLEAHTDLGWHLVLVDDGATDPDLRALMQGWEEARRGRVTLVEIDLPLGFAAAVNRGLAAAGQGAGHVVILGVDSWVPPGWASRLLAPFDRDAAIAAVAPLADAAGGAPAALPPGLVDRLDGIARSLTQPDRLPDVPGGPGPCLALSARWLARLPRLDETLGPGAGAEIDWVQRARRMGGRAAGLPGLFVGRAGPGPRAPLAPGLARRHPGLEAELRAFAGRDPMRTPRLALAVAAAGYLGRDALPLFLAHSLGGGADLALAAEIAARTAAGQQALVLRVGGRLRWQLELHGPGGVLSGATDVLADLQRLLAPVPALRLVYSCGVGDPDPVALPWVMLALMRPGRCDRLEARLHDFFPVSPSYCLLGSDGAFRGPVRPDSDDPAHVARRPDGTPVTLAAWQQAWEGFLAASAEVTVFSDASRRLILASYPALAGRVVLRPHGGPVPVRPVVRPEGGPPVLGVLGNINRAKGGAILCELAARMARRPGAPRLVLIGNLDTAFAPPPALRLHGSYDRRDIADLAERYGITAWLMPAIWPETYSFVTHEMLATGLPVYGFAIGGQGEALGRAQNGHPIPFDPDADHAAAILAALDAAEQPPRRGLRYDQAAE